MKIYLLRHGEAVTNSEGCFPTDDTRLTAKGKEQAVSNGKHLADHGIEVIYTSPLTRAIETSRIIATKLKCPVIVKENLRDYCFGILSGKAQNSKDAGLKKLIAEFEGDKLNYRFPKGENFPDLQERISPILNEILSSGRKKVAIVGHLYGNRVILANLLGISLQESLNVDIPNGIIYLVDTETKSVSYRRNSEIEEGLLLNSPKT